MDRKTAFEGLSGRRADDQRAVVAFLSRRESYDGSGAAVECIDTHCSIVFLVGDRAYKLKRAVAFASLDYTTVEERERTCRAELELNRRTAPDLYLGVRSVNLSHDGALAFDGPGTAVDWVVIMRRFDQTDLLDRMAEEGRLTDALMRSLSEEIARFHAGAEIMPAFGGAEGVRRAITHNLHELLQRNSLQDGHVARNLHAASLVSLDRVAALLDDRRAQGRVRRCHGDLRLANICLFRGRPTLFDCIEFSEEICCIDVLYDLAFLLMDLRQRELGHLADVALQRYVEVTGDREGLTALPLFLSVRAATRSYAMAGAATRTKEPETAARLTAQAQSLLALACAFLTVAPPRCVG